MATAGTVAMNRGPGTGTGISGLGAGCPAGDRGDGAAAIRRPLPPGRGSCCLSRPRPGM